MNSVTSLQSKVLVLSKIWEVVNVITAEEALCKIANGRAKALEVHHKTFMDYDLDEWLDHSTDQYNSDHRDLYHWINGVGCKVAVPDVILLQQKIYSRASRRVKLSRRNLWVRDGKRCAYCGRSLDICEATRDHIVPQARGGRNTWTNLVTSCFPCNARKRDRTPHQAEMPLRVKPYRPTHKELEIVADTPKPTWSTFIDAAYYEASIEND